MDSNNNLAKRINFNPSALQNDKLNLTIVANPETAESARPAVGYRDYLYGARRLSAHVSPLNESLAPAVSMLPAEEVESFRQTIVQRYIRQLKAGYLKKPFAAIFTEEVQALSDRDYIRLLTQTTNAKSISACLSESDRQIFEINGDDRRDYFKFDYMDFDRLTPLDGFHIYGNIALVSRDDKGLFHPQAIYLNRVVYRPGDGDAWELAKYYVASTSVLHVLYAEHPLVHFPVDVVNAVTKSALPRNHLVLKLLLPHSFLQLPLNFGVLYQQRSIMHNDQSEMYTPFPYRNAGELLQIMGDRYQGWNRGSGSNRRYAYPMSEREEVTDYDRYLNAYYNTILRFVQKIVAAVPAGDPLVSAWAREISMLVEGFPDEHAIWEADNLARAIAGYIWNCSVVHSADHHTLSEFPLNKVPFRLRVASPEKKGFRLDRKSLMTKQDLFRQKIAVEMFIKPHAVTRLIDVDYGFVSEQHRAENVAFIENLKLAERDLPVSRFMKVSEIAASIQY